MCPKFKHKVFAFNLKISNPIYLDGSGPNFKQPDKT